MNLSVLLHTIAYLKPSQIIGQILYRLFKPKFLLYNSGPSAEITLAAKPIVKNSSYSNGTFLFLNKKASFESWNDKSYGTLWSYNLNYMDWILQKNINTVEATCWIDRFIKDTKVNTIGFEPYPISLRCINWVKFFTINTQYRTKTRDNHLFSQFILLTRMIEYHLLGNHILENACSIYIGSIYFRNKSLHKKAVKILINQLNEQILSDGSHFEQSPMYHCIILDRLLDCLNFSLSSTFHDDKHVVSSIIKNKTQQMLGHLESIIWDDGTIPILNDTALGIAPHPSEIFHYASELGLKWKAIKMKECGYRRLKNLFFDAIVDIGNITAYYQPGHSHADTFNYELRIGRDPFVIDTGISTYENDERREYERGSSAHNTVVISGKNSSETWKSFRIGKRAKVIIVSESEDQIEATHNGYGCKLTHSRCYSLKTNHFIVHDSLSGIKVGVSYIHFDSTVKIVSYNKKSIITNKAIILLEGADSVTILNGKASNEFNSFHNIVIAAISFSKNLIQTFQLADSIGSIH